MSGENGFDRMEFEGDDAMERATRQTGIHQRIPLPIRLLRAAHSLIAMLF